MICLEKTYLSLLKVKVVFQNICFSTILFPEYLLSVDVTNYSACCKLLLIFSSLIRNICYMMILQDFDQLFAILEMDANPFLGSFVVMG